MDAKDRAPQAPERPAANAANARCPLCAAPARRPLADASDVAREIEMLWAFHGRRLRAGAPVASLADRVAFSQRAPRTIMRCEGCGLVFRHPRPRARDVTALYAAEAPSAAVLAALLSAQRAGAAAQLRRLEHILRDTARVSAPPPPFSAPGSVRRRSVLEVGSYTGAFLQAAGRAGWTAEGVDVNETINTFARAHGLRVSTGEIRDIDGRARFDAVVFWNCLDQLPDPAAAVREARRLITADGMLAVRVPNGAFYAALQPRVHGRFGPIASALLAHANLLTFPYCHGFSVRALTSLVERAGFAVRAVRGDALMPASDAWTRRWARTEARCVRFATRLLAPLDAALAPWIELYATPARVGRSADGLARGRPRARSARLAR